MFLSLFKNKVKNLIKLFLMKLLGENMYKLYIDGGGTKTAGFLLDENMTLIDKYQSGQGNINTDYESALKHIKEIINYFNNYKYDQLTIGVAGATTNIKNKDLLFYEIKKIINNNINLLVCSDMELMTMLLVPKNVDNALLINLGTGTSSIYYDGSSYKEHLGWGRIINDLGSGYDIGLNVIKHLCRWEDLNKNNIIYNKFLKDFNTPNVREYIPNFSNPNNVANLSGWVVNNFSFATKLFVIPRVKACLDYLSYLKTDNIYCVGSVFLKNKEVQEFVKNYYKNKNVFFVSIDDIIK